MRCSSLYKSLHLLLTEQLLAFTPPRPPKNLFLGGRGREGAGVSVLILNYRFELCSTTVVVWKDDLLADDFDIYLFWRFLDIL